MIRMPPAVVLCDRYWKDMTMTEAVNFIAFNLLRLMTSCLSEKKVHLVPRARKKGVRWQIMVFTWANEPNAVYNFIHIDQFINDTKKRKRKGKTG